MKLDDYTVGRRYGKAMFELAHEKGILDEVYTELCILRDVFEQNPDFGPVLSDVRLKLDKKRALVDALASQFSETVANFIQIVAKYGRLYDIAIIVDEFERMYNDHKGIVIGTVTTAVALTNEQKAKLEINFARRLGYKTAKLENIVDPTIIGGAIAIANSVEIDGSIRTQLEKIRTQLIKD